jgi:hypothetical protein
MFLLVISWWLGLYLTLTQSVAQHRFHADSSSSENVAFRRQCDERECWVVQTPKQYEGLQKRLSKDLAFAKSTRECSKVAKWSTTWVSSIIFVLIMLRVLLCAIN